ncbi:MAG: ATP-binding cassette domain-containing protein, partial [Paraperlucidibaca sp.]
MTELLQLRDISKRFGGVRALKGIDLSIPEGTIYGLIGPNGAGKTTLFNIITGMYTADTGTRLLNGVALPLTIKPYQIVERGIARTFQNIRLFHYMTALENIMVGCHRHSRAGLFATLFNSASAQAEEASISARAFELLDYVGLPR